MDVRERHLRLLTETIAAVNSTLDLEEVLALVARKVGRVMTLRQLVPAFFVVVVALLAALAGPVALLRLPFAMLLLTYTVADVAFAVRAGGTGGIQCVLWLALVFPVLHWSYGLGFLKGLADLVLRRHRVGGPVLAPSR